MKRDKNMMPVISTGHVTMYVGIVAYQRTAKMYKRYSHRCTGSNGGITVQCMCISYSHPSHLYKYIIHNKCMHCTSTVLSYVFIELTVFIATKVEK